jgi:hypothetical protein
MKRKKERLAFTLERKRESQEPYDLVLIVCEGEKTEPQYFCALRDALRLSRANIRVCGKECGSAPISVVDYAIAECEKDPYDRVFCVFDRDGHANFRKAIQKAAAQQYAGGAAMEAITSVPCFEFWFLLHYKDTARPYTVSGKKSACDNVIRDLKKHVPEYAKGKENVFALTFPRVGTAIKRARLLEKRQSKAGSENPSTKAHHLVEYLRSLNK